VGEGATHLGDLPHVEDDPDFGANGCDTLVDVHEALAEIEATRLALQQRLSEDGVLESFLRAEVVRAQLIAKKHELRAIAAEEEVERIRNSGLSASREISQSGEIDISANGHAELEATEACSAHDLAWAVQLKVRNSTCKDAEDDDKSSASSLQCDLTEFMEDAF